MWCKRLDTVVFNAPEGMEYFTNKMVLAKLNAEVDTTLKQHYKISGYPTAVLVDKDGNEIDRIVGFMELADYLKTLDDYQQGIGTLDDLLAQAETNSDRQLYFDIADKYKYRGGAEEAKIWCQKVIDAGEPTDSLSGEARFALADMTRRSKDYAAAVIEFDKIAADFKGQWFAEDAEIWKAICFREKGDTATAIQLFEDYIVTYPDSENVEYAQEQVKNLKEVPETEQN